MKYHRMSLNMSSGTPPPPQVFILHVKSGDIKSCDLTWSQQLVQMSNFCGNMSMLKHGE